MTTIDEEKITASASARNQEILQKGYRRELADLPAKYLAQAAHLTCPAPRWALVEKAVASNANLVMLDLEDSIPRGNEALLKQGRENIVRAFTELDWSGKIRYFRPRGLELDPGFSDIVHVITQSGHLLDGFVYPKVESPEEVESIDQTLTELETANGLPKETLTFQVLIESVEAERRVFEIALASGRITALVFGAFDYWSSMGLPPGLYSPDHPLVREVRCRIVKAAACAGVPAIAEMTLNFPTKNKSEAQQKAALEQCRKDAELARYFGFAGKWTGIPAQTDVVREVFGLKPDQIETALREAQAYMEAEAQGKGAVMIDGKMADRATDRLNRTLLKQAYAQGMLDKSIAEELALI